MSALLIWMDSSEARLFHVDSNSIHVEKIFDQQAALTPRPSAMNPMATTQNEISFFQQLSDKLKTIGSAKWLLMGSGFTPTHFRDFLEKHHDDMFKKLIGVEKVDKMPDSEILSVGRKHLQRYYQFQSA